MNVFQLMADYRRAARKAGVSSEVIDSVLKDAQSGDYAHACEVLEIASENL